MRRWKESVLYSLHSEHPKGINRRLARGSFQPLFAAGFESSVACACVGPFATTVLPKLHPHSDVLLPARVLRKVRRKPTQSYLSLIFYAHFNLSFTSSSSNRKWALPWHGWPKFSPSREYPVLSYRLLCGLCRNSIFSCAVLRRSMLELATRIWKHQDFPTIFGEVQISSDPQSYPLLWPRIWSS